MPKPSKLTVAAAVAAGSALLTATAQAQAPITGPKGPLLAAASNSSTVINDLVRVPRGGRVTLPFEGVTRVITGDDDVARASYSGGRAVLEGVGNGETTVELYQGTSTPRLLSVRVQEGPVGPAVITNIAGTPDDAQAASPSAAIAPAHSPLIIGLQVAPAQGAPSQAQFTITYGNPGVTNAQNVIVHFTLDDSVSYVPNSASNGGKYDAALREVTWNLGTVPANTTGQRLTLRVEPVERQRVTFDAVATIEDESGASIVSNQVRYSTATTPLLTVFALPDRFLAGRAGPVLVDVKGIEFQSAVDRLQQLGVVSGRQPGLFYPASPTQRAEYAVMTLNGLNLRDLRDITQIKFVLGRRSAVDLVIQNSNNKVVANLVKNTTFEPGEHTAVWNGRVGTTFAPPGRYTYICTARDERGEQTVLKGNLNIVPQTPLKPEGKPSFIDVKPTDWYAGYLAVGEKQGLLYGYENKTFKPTKSISRVEATAIVVRALGLEDLAKEWANKDVGFLDYQNIEPWARGYVNVASTVAKTGTGKPIMRGKPTNLFEPNRNLRRDEAALIVQRLIDRESNRRVNVSGAIVPGATVTINSKSVDADENGLFSFSVETNSAVPVTVAVIDTRDR
jgi:uncharacterized repeat protein (TIGR01451 family)